jgi:2-iminoacetate synthase
MINFNDKYLVSDEDFKKLIAILRLSVPYTGLILTAREAADVRKDAMSFGVSQIDGGTKIELGGYSESKNEQQNLNREQFRISDDRSLAEVIDELMNDDFLPSFCTACYRLGRTGEHFMEFSVPGFIKRYCTPNAILTLAEYLVDYATPELAEKGWKAIEKNMADLDESVKEGLRTKIELIRNGKRDLYY